MSPQVLRRERPFLIWLVASVVGALVLVLIVSITTDNDSSSSAAPVPAGACAGVRVVTASGADLCLRNQPFVLGGVPGRRVIGRVVVPRLGGPVVGGLLPGGRPGVPAAPSLGGLLPTARVSLRSGLSPLQVPKPCEATQTF